MPQAPARGLLAPDMVPYPSLPRFPSQFATPCIFVCTHEVIQCVFGVQAPDRGLPAPDVVLYLSLPLDVAEKRGGFGQERYERREMQQQAYVSAAWLLQS